MTNFELELLDKLLDKAIVVCDNKLAVDVLKGAKHAIDTTILCSDNQPQV